MSSKKVLIPNPPRGLKAIPWRLPIWMYRLKLGRFLGHRFLLLNHTGRKSGLPRQAVLEVVKFEKDSNTHIVASGFGEKADWYLNITHTPEVSIQVAGEEIFVKAERLASPVAANVFREYHRHHPKALQGLSKLIGYKVSNVEEEMLAFFSEHIPLIAFRPTQPT